MVREDVIVVGAGVIGLSAARRAASLGRVTVIDRNLVGREASWAAAGMLSPRSEAASDDLLLRFGLDSLSSYRAFADELREETGIDPEYRSDGVLVLARTEEERRELEVRAEWQNAIGLGVELLEPAEAARLEPAIGEVAGALFYADDHQIRPRRLIRALRRSCQLRGVRLVEGAPVTGVRIERGRVKGVRAGFGGFDAGAVIVTAGAWSSDVLNGIADWRTRPRKGQILSLAAPGPVIHHVVRWRNFYLVPRNDDTLVVGATNEDAGFDRSVTLKGLRGLMDAAESMAPAVADFPVRETWTGFRPWTPDGLPRIGPAGIEGLHCATGHYRNGILWAPATAAILEGYLAGKALPDYAVELAPSIRGLRYPVREQTGCIIERS